MILPKHFAGKKYKKGAMFTDIHFGKHSNSAIHNQDCLDFIDWFVDNVKKDPSIDHIIFLGDWNENRSALNISTLNYSYIGAKKLNQLGLPVFFIIGNHDLYQRHTRDIHSVISFNEFSNFILIDSITQVDEVGDGVIFCPFLFHEEYKELQKYREISTWYGHFEFKGFMVTGYGMKMPTGPDANDFTGPSRIFSGHFHKRQIEKNICYIGNTFPMDFGDTNDLERGMAIYEYASDDLQFLNWKECPKYVKIKLSELLEDKTFELDVKARVKCVIDMPLEYEESTALKQKFQTEAGLREFTLEESKISDSEISDIQTDVNVDDLGSTDDLVIKMLSDIENEQIDSELLISIYKELQVVQ